MHVTTLQDFNRCIKGVALVAVLSTAAFSRMDSETFQLAQRPDGPPGRRMRNDFRQDEQGTSTATNQVSITIEGNFRVIHANGIPDHQPGQFPNRNNPNRIGPQEYNYRVPVKPQMASSTTALRMQPFGIAVNGVVFDPFAAEWWDNDPNSGWQFEPQFLDGKLGVDDSNAHVQPTGAYHYHGIPHGLVKKLSGGKEKMVLLGWAADGFPIYNQMAYSDAKNTNSPLKQMKPSYKVKKGTRSGGPGGEYDGRFVADWEYVKGVGDLDESNGRFGKTPEFPAGTYYYLLTETFPFIPRYYKGSPDQSFARRGPPGGFGRGGRGRGPGGQGGPGFGPPR
jgi:hypothetical protein